MSHVVIIINNHKPLPKQRPSWSNGRAYKPKKTRDYESLISDISKATMFKNKVSMFTGENPLKITVTFVFEVPRSWPQKDKQKALDGHIYPTGKNIGDVDNLIKSCLDGMNNIVFKDDRYIAEIYGKKKYGKENQTIILVEEIINE